MDPRKRPAFAILAMLFAAGCLATNAGKQAGGDGTGNSTGTGSTAGTGSGTATGTNDPGCLVVTPTSLDFGNTPFNTTIEKSITLRNGCSAPLDNITVALVGQDANLFKVLDAPASVASNAEVTVDITFSPLALVARSSAKAIFAGSYGEQSAVNLLGEPVGVEPQFSCTPLTIDFGQTLAHSISTIPVICTNTGSAIAGLNLTLDPPLASPSVFTAEFDQINDPYPLAGLGPGESVQIDVNYAPTGNSNDTGTLVLTFDGGRTLKIPLSGTGLNVPPCQFVVVPAALDFANVELGESLTLSFEIQNIGSNICLVQGVSIGENCAGEFQITRTSIAPDPTTGMFVIPAPAPGVVSNLTVDVAFTPTAYGAASCELDGLAWAPIELSGTSEATCLTVEPTSLDFGHVGASDAALGTSTRTFQVSTQCQGTTLLESMSLRDGPGDTEPQFSLSPGQAQGPSFPVAVTAASPASYEVTCQPTTQGTHVAQLLISDGTLETLLALSCDAP